MSPVFRAAGFLAVAGLLVLAAVAPAAGALDSWKQEIQGYGKVNVYYVEVKDYLRYDYKFDYCGPVYVVFDYSKVAGRLDPTYYMRKLVKGYHDHAPHPYPAGLDWSNLTQSALWDQRKVEAIKRINAELEAEAHGLVAAVVYRVEEGVVALMVPVGADAREAVAKAMPLILSEFPWVRNVIVFEVLSAKSPLELHDIAESAAKALHGLPGLEERSVRITATLYHAIAVEVTGETPDPHAIVEAAKALREVVGCGIPIVFIFNYTPIKATRTPNDGRICPARVEDPGPNSPAPATEPAAATPPSREPAGTDQAFPLQGAHAAEAAAPPATGTMEPPAEPLMPEQQAKTGAAQSWRDAWIVALPAAVTMIAIAAALKRES